VNAVAVNCAPWSVLKISGRPREVDPKNWTVQ
jgi:hypothetical protein